MEKTTNSSNHRFVIVFKSFFEISFKYQGQILNVRT